MVRRRSQAPSVDLHGMGVQEALKVLVSFCNRVYLSGYRGWVTVVHGYGSTNGQGVIKPRVRSLFARHGESFDFRFNDAANPGSTDVRILKPLPEQHRTSTPLEAQVLEFCGTPKEETKIGSKFHRLPIAELKKVLRELLAHGKLVLVKTNGRKALLAIEGRSLVEATDE